MFKKSAAQRQPGRQRARGLLKHTKDSRGAMLNKAREALHRRRVILACIHLNEPG